MYNRFDNYLSNEFKGLAHTKEVNDYKEELLGTLMEKAEDFKAQGIEDEDQIFKMCIESIKGFKDTLKELKGKPLVIKSAIRAANVLLYFAIYFVLIIGAYLAVSFTTDAWDITWVLLVEAIFLGLIVFFIILLVKNFHKKNYAIGRSLIAPIVSVMIVGLYLGASFYYENIWSISWMLFLCLPLLILLGDIIAGAFTGKNKLFITELIAFISLLSVFSYISLAILGIIAWHPFWLIILGGVLVDIIILAVYLKTRTNKKY